MRENNNQSHVLIYSIEYWLWSRWYCKWDWSIMMLHILDKNEQCWDLYKNEMPHSEADSQPRLSNWMRNEHWVSTSILLDTYEMKIIEVIDREFEKSIESNSTKLYSLSSMSRKLKLRSGTPNCWGCLWKGRDWYPHSWL